MVRYGGLVRREEQTSRYQSNPYLCPSCGEEVVVHSMNLNTMEPIPLWQLDLEHYISYVGSHGIPEQDRPTSCPQCQVERKQHRHSHFLRDVVTLSLHARIAIFRFRCPGCYYVHSVIPSFLEPYQRLALDLQEDLIQALEGGTSQEAVAAATDTLPEGSRSDKTIGRLYRSWTIRLKQL